MSSSTFDGIFDKFTETSASIYELLLSATEQVDDVEITQQVNAAAEDFLSEINTRSDTLRVLVSLLDGWFGTHGGFSKLKSGVFHATTRESLQGILAQQQIYPSNHPVSREQSAWTTNTLAHQTGSVCLFSFHCPMHVARVFEIADCCFWTRPTRPRSTFLVHFLQTPDAATPHDPPPDSGNYIPGAEYLHPGPLLLRGDILVHRLVEDSSWDTRLLSQADELLT